MNEREENERRRMIEASKEIWKTFRTLQLQFWLSPGETGLKSVLQGQVLQDPGRVLQDSGRVLQDSG
jgi:hypothetical protein